MWAPPNILYSYIDILIMNERILIMMCIMKYSMRRMINLEKDIPGFLL